MAPVSYTHLDVYKRQERDIAALTAAVDLAALTVEREPAAPIDHLQKEMCIRDRQKGRTHLRYFVKDYESALWDLDSRLP